jgi:NtrC-family two-component system sensor histidine kinase KinB
VLKPVPLKQHGGGSFGTILILQDITYLRDKDRARTNLVATLSHELKTPLTSLALSAELLERRAQLDEEGRHLLETLREDIGRMTRLTNDLLDLARGGGAIIAVQTAAVDVTQLIRSVVRSFALQCEQKGVRLEVSCESPALLVRGDAMKLSWVISNLIANALRYTPGGGVITVSAEEEGAQVRLSVRDTGPGIAPELREHLFERFAQGASVNGTAPGTAGLGLAIAREIVEAHDGRIFAESGAAGTCFTVELKAAQRSEDGWRGS